MEKKDQATKNAHYAKQREKGNETIVALELFSEQLSPSLVTGDISPSQFVNIILAKKNFDRAGTKDDVMQEIEKAENYLHRARTGKWIDTW